MEFSTFTFSLIKIYGIQGRKHTSQSVYEDLLDTKLNEFIPLEPFKKISTVPRLSSHV